MSAIEDIAAERQRQMDVEGWHPDHDDLHDSGQLAAAAGVYAIGMQTAVNEGRPVLPTVFWPWEGRWLKWSNGDRRRDLVKAGALIVAEIERLDRSAVSNGQRP